MPRTMKGFPWASRSQLRSQLVPPRPGAIALNGLQRLSAAAGANPRRARPANEARQGGQHSSYPERLLSVSASMDVPPRLDDSMPPEATRSRYSGVSRPRQDHARATVADLFRRPTMKLLSDEMLSPAIARELRARGHDGEAIAGHPNREALTDPEVMALARPEHRAVVTNDLRDCRPLHSDAIVSGGAGLYGIIFMPGAYHRTKNDTGRIITALEAELRSYPGDSDLAAGED